MNTKAFEIIHTMRAATLSRCTSAHKLSYILSDLLVALEHDELDNPFTADDPSHSKAVASLDEAIRYLYWGPAGKGYVLQALHAFMYYMCIPSVCTDDW
jgi:hypothetical protein